ncbi:MAG: L,D-transpeptidase [Dysgonomonas sp.]|nr:L,D-transpeptidase [Dysgonomonas sp.]
MRIIFSIFILLANLFSFSFCTNFSSQNKHEEVSQDSLAVEDTIPIIDTLAAADIIIEKELLFDKYTLEDTYPYKDTTREFQWEKIRKGLAHLVNIQENHPHWAILQNYKNKNGEAPLVKKYKRNVYKRIADTLGVERYQSVPLYLPGDSVPERYGRDGSPVKYLGDSADYIKVETVTFEGIWMVPKRYIVHIADSITFTKAVVVDVKNQNITTLDQDSTQKAKWIVRSMNPSTTGRHAPPYAQETPVGMYVIEEKKPKMLYLKDGSSELGGFAPWASRFTNGAYLHGVPTNAPGTKIIEYSASLGTTPRSHMCVRNASSHAKFIYDWGILTGTIVFVID